MEPPRWSTTVCFNSATPGEDSQDEIVLYEMYNIGILLHSHCTYQTRTHTLDFPSIWRAPDFLFWLHGKVMCRSPVQNRRGLLSQHSCASTIMNPSYLLASRTVYFHDRRGCRGLLVPSRYTNFVVLVLLQTSADQAVRDVCVKGEGPARQRSKCDVRFVKSTFG
jgi:hypothetical protein